MTGRPVVSVVHCVDTEGPLDESLEATFSRLKDVFGLEFEPDEERLSRLRRGEGVPAAIREAVVRMLDPHAGGYLRDWTALEAMLDRTMDPAFRRALPDRRGEGWISTWFCLDHVGYEHNPRRRDLGHHRVWDRYAARLAAAPGCRDALQFHYHPFPWNRMAHSCATSYLHSPHLVGILGRKLLERSWFPSVYRPGFHTIRPDSHWFLEQWFPFDYSNQSTDEETDQPDLADGRFGDWRRAPRTWRGYRPDARDWQREGGCRRTTFRCLNLESRLRSLRPHHVDEAFREARETGRAVLAFTSHDFRDLGREMDALRAMLGDAARRHPDVDFEYADALSAARDVASGGAASACGLAISLEQVDGADRLEVSTMSETFGPQPFLALETDSGEVLHDNFDFGREPTSWRYALDWQTVPRDRIRRIGVAATSPTGVVEIEVLDRAGNRIAKETLHA